MVVHQPVDAHVLDPVQAAAGEHLVRHRPLVEQFRMRRPALLHRLEVPLVARLELRVGPCYLVHRRSFLRYYFPCRRIV